MIKRTVALLILLWIVIAVSTSIAVYTMLSKVQIKDSVDIVYENQLAKDVIAIKELQKSNRQLKDSVRVLNYRIHFENIEMEGE